MASIEEILLNLWNDSGFSHMFAAFKSTGWQNLVMIIVGCVLLYLGIGKKFEPLLLVGIAFGCILTNLPGAGLYNQGLWDNFMAEFLMDENGEYLLNELGEKIANPAYHS